MNAYKTTIFGSIFIIIISTWGAIEASFSPTAFIPLALAFLLLLCANGVKKENKIMRLNAVLEEIRISEKSGFGSLNFVRSDSAMK